MAKLNSQNSKDKSAELAQTHGIIQIPHPTLRKKARHILVEEIGTPKLNAIIAKMSLALKTQEDGVALAAPQINESLQLFIVSGRIIEMIEGELTPTEADEKMKVTKRPDSVFINPIIVKRSKKTKMMEEGCLSVRNKYGRIKRSTNVTIEALDQNGNKVKRGAGGLLAQIFQHETDHLHGVLFIDNAVDVDELTEELTKENPSEKVLTKK